MRGAAQIIERGVRRTDADGFVVVAYGTGPVAARALEVGASLCRRGGQRIDQPVGVRVRTMRDGPQDQAPRMPGSRRAVAMHEQAADPAVAMDELAVQPDEQ